MKKHIDNSKILEKIELDMNNNAVSHTEATGLIPALRDDEYELNSYREIVNYVQRPMTKQEKCNNR